MHWKEVHFWQPEYCFSYCTGQEGATASCRGGSQKLEKINTIFYYQGLQILVLDSTMIPQSQNKEK